jgi:hypothetical protein
MKEITKNDYVMTDLDYRKILYKKYFIPWNIEISSEYSDQPITYGMNNIIVEGYENDILEWLKYINRTRHFYKLEFEDTTIGLVTYKVQYLSITDYDIKDHLNNNTNNQTTNNTIDTLIEEEVMQQTLF